MKADQQLVLGHIFASEGGFTNHPADPGGPTNFGITIYDARKYGAEFGWIANPTIADMRAMPRSFAEQVYIEKYFAPIHFDDLPAGVDYAVADYGVNSGISRAAKVLQRLVGATPDGAIGPKTLAAVAGHASVSLINEICDERLAFLKGLHTWPVFGAGWGARVSSVRAVSLAMAQGQAPHLMAIQAGHVIGKGYDVAALAA